MSDVLSIQKDAYVGEDSSILPYDLTIQCWVQPNQLVDYAANVVASSPSNLHGLLVIGQLPQGGEEPDDPHEATLNYFEFLELVLRDYPVLPASSFVVLVEHRFQFANLPFGRLVLGRLFEESLRKVVGTFSEAS